MPTPLVRPTTIPTPFAISGTKNVIPTAASPTPGLASLVEGFPAETMIPITGGGVPPSGDDFNGIFNLISQHSAWLNAGGMYLFDAALAAYIGGYPAGTVLQSNDGLSSYLALSLNSTDFNSTPSSIGTIWQPYAGAAVGASQTTISTTGGSTTLSSLQYSARYIIVTGVLVSNATLVVPTTLRDWRVINQTTGSYSVTVKTAAGTGVTVLQGGADSVYADGTNVGYQNSSAVTQALANNSNANASTAYVDRAVAQVGGYYQDTGVVLNAYVITTIPATVAPVNGQSIRMRTTRANTTTSPTLNAGGGAVQMLREDRVALQPGDISVGSITTMTYDTASGAAAWLVNEIVPSQLGALAVLNIGAFLFNDGAGNLAAVDQSSAILYQLGLAF